MFCSKEHLSHWKTERRLRDLPSVQFFPPHPFSHSQVYEPSLFTHTLPTLHGLESHSSTSALKKRLWNVSTWIFNYIWIQRPLWSPNHSAKNEGYKAHLTTSTFVKTNMVTKSPFWPQTLLLTIMDTKPIWTASSLCP